MDKMPLGTPPERGTAAPAHFLVHVYCGQMAGWIRIPLGTEVDLGPGDTVLDGDPAPLMERGTADPPLFGPLCSGMVAHDGPISVTAVLLFHI